MVTFVMGMFAPFLSTKNTSLTDVIELRLSLVAKVQGFVFFVAGSTAMCSFALIVEDGDKLSPGLKILGDVVSNSTLILLLLIVYDVARKNVKKVVKTFNKVKREISTRFIRGSTSSTGFGREVGGGAQVRQETLDSDDDKEDEDTLPDLTRRSTTLDALVGRAGAHAGEGIV